MIRSFVLAAALGAGSGAAITAAIMSQRTKTASPSTAAVSPSPPLPPSKSPIQPPIPSAVGLVNPAGLFKYGFPGPVADLAVRSALVSAYDRRTRNPHWVIEHMTAASLAQRGGDRAGSRFVEDEAVPAQFRARLADYARSGYDRGHQVPAADTKWSQAAMDETFFLTNMCPQVGDGFNRDYWAHLEDFCRRLTARYPSVRVATGPLYLPRLDPADGRWYVRYQVIGAPPNVAVPTHFYKVIFAEDGRVGGDVALAAFVLPNAPIPNDKPLADFEVPLDAVERASGLEFAARLNPARRRSLCADIACSIIVKDFSNRQRPRAGSASPPPPPPPPSR